ncbi:right-handed parallel beta-helix repeat-containing protein [uncultured Victivallis sp.]|uniref:right-handed parallel beta-helix repeat-containing protein n=1 Tax=uncultured Victivallis sp. TaxID=354118 RepID=UPI0025EF5F5A|nr:right-handed parallel beta-helix repeat-containing protein [uncultured Victivallis sp.]
MFRKIHRLPVLLLFCLGLTAGGSNVDPLQAELDQAIRSGRKQIVLSQKEYRLTRPVVLSNLRDRVIDGNGARIVVTTATPKRGVCAIILTNRTRGVTLRNFTIDYDPVPFTQGEVTAVKGRQIHFKLDRGYPQLEAGRIGGCHSHIFTASGEWKKNQGDVYGYIKSRGDGTGFVDSTAAPVNVQPGDRIAIDWRGKAGAPAIDMHRMTGYLRFENITIQASPGVAFRCYHGEGGDIFRNCRIERGPRLPGMERDRLLSIVADGIHFGYARRGITVENCDFGWMGDDALNLHGPLQVAGKITGEHTFHLLVPGKITASTIFSRLTPGSTLRMLDPNNYRIIGRYTYCSYRRLPGEEYPVEEAKKLLHRMNSQWSRGIHTLFEVTVKEKLDLPANFVFDIPSVNCRGYRIANNYFHDHRARGLRIMASDGIIENNRFERIKGAAITALAEYSRWGECGWIDNLTIRSNLIRSCGHSQSGPQAAANNYTPGAISVCVQLDDYSKAAAEHRNIVIENNRIEDVPFAAIFLLGVKSGRVTGNTMAGVWRAGYLPGRAKISGLRRQPIEILHSGRIEVHSNTVEAAGRE